ncbi:MAG: 3-phosphoshikimate 1-carboxyvinyltransferase, partial [Acidimicrobiia bacterium]
EWLHALEALGVSLTRTGDQIVVDSAGVRAFQPPAHALDCGNSGSAMRMLLGVLAGCSFPVELTGDASLSQRPMGRVVDPLRRMGAHIDGREDGRFAPLRVQGGALGGTTFVLPVASAQVKTALLFAGLQATGETTVVEPVLSRDHTERMLRASGTPIASTIDETGAHTVRITGGLEALGPCSLRVPGDPSTAAFFAVAAAIIPGASVTLHHTAINPARLGFLDVLRRMGATVVVTPVGDAHGEPVGVITVTGGPLHATEIGGSEIPNVIDEIPVLAVAAACAAGTTVVRDATEMRVKESDRIATTVELLTRLGARAEATRDGLVVYGGARLTGGVVQSHGDHRIAMSAAIAGLIANGETTVEGWSCVAVSAPQFADDVRALGGALT